MLPQRTDPHRVDTIAVRYIEGLFDADWVKRDFAERDYGIDMQMEHFSGSDPTGDIVLFQIKGTDSPIDLI